LNMLLVTHEIALLISVIFIIICIGLKIPIGISVLAGAFLLAIFVIPFKNIPAVMLKTITDENTWQLLAVVICTMTFSSLMEQKGLLRKLAEALENFGPSLAVHILPIVIGLVPMPAGALVAATAVKELADKLELKAEQIAFINYWFRHIWEASMPFYPAVIIAGTVLDVPVASVTKILFPITLLMVFSGSFVSYQILRHNPGIKLSRKDSTGKIVLNLLKSGWPILFLMMLIFLKVRAWIAFLLTLVILIIQQKTKRFELKKSLKYGLNPLVLLLLVSVMLYQMVIRDSDAAGALVRTMQNTGISPLLLLTGLPFLVGLATGYGSAPSGIALPVLVPFIMSGHAIHWQALMVAGVSGMMGQLLSPAHLCFSLSAEYFKTPLGKVYRYTLPLASFVELVAILIYVFIR